jgi:hypothetical protein
MTVPAVNGCGGAAGHAEPGDLIRLVADGLAGCGLEVSLSDPEGAARLDITCEAGQCRLSVNDWAYAELDYSPRSRDQADPQLTADLATALLTGRAGPYPRLPGGYLRDGITFKGIVGVELKARGLDVGLEVYEDENYFDVNAEIVITVPGSQDGTKVWVTDEGCLTWTRDYWGQTATIVFEPEFCGWITNPADVAATVVATTTQAISCLHGTGHGVASAAGMSGTDDHARRASLGGP